MKQTGYNAAAFLLKNDIAVGDTLRGEPIYVNGAIIECAREVIVTAIGESAVLARRTKLLSEDHQTIAVIEEREHLMAFNAREWHKVLTPLSARSTTEGEETE